MGLLNKQNKSTTHSMECYIIPNYRAKYFDRSVYEGVISDRKYNEWNNKLSEFVRGEFELKEFIEMAMEVTDNLNSAGYVRFVADEEMGYDGWGSVLRFNIYLDSFIFTKVFELIVHLKEQVDNQWLNDYTDGIIKQTKQGNTPRLYPR